MASPIIIAVCGQKGGIGKTTFTINVAEILAHCGCKVLCIDNDEQHNLSNALGARVGGFDISDVYSNDFDDEKFIAGGGIQKTKIDGLDCISCCGKINKIDNFNYHNLGGLVFALSYDYCFIDCAPGTGLIQNDVAMQTAEYYLLPTELKQFSFTGLNVILDIITSRYGRDINNVLIVPNFVDVSYLGNVKTKKHIELLEVLKKMHPGLVSETFIPYDESIDNCIIENKSLFLDKLKSSKSSGYFIKLISELANITEDDVYEIILVKRSLYMSENARKNYYKNKALTGDTDEK